MLLNLKHGNCSEAVTIESSVCRERDKLTSLLKYNLM